jgi:cytosine/creatinine deaminase
MCTGTILLYKISVVVIGENKTFKGPEDYSQSRGVKLINLESEECKQMMRDFIRERPELWNEDIGI